MKWSDTDKFLYELDALWEETLIRFPGHTSAFWVVPYVKVNWHETTRTSVKAWEPRKPWHKGKQRRAAFWVIHQTELEDESAQDSHHHRGQFKTQRAAKEEAHRLAHEEKAHALLAPQIHQHR